MAKKKLSVPQAGTQPAKAPTPMENMLSGFLGELEELSAEVNASEAAREAKAAAVEYEEPFKHFQTKKAVNFLCDADVFLRFKLYCTRNHRTMTSVLEGAINQILLGDELSAFHK